VSEISPFQTSTLVMMYISVNILVFSVMLQMCEVDSEASLSNIDLILKWNTLRFFDTNTTVLMKQLEYLQALLNMAATERYHLHEIEAISFIPYLINKVIN